MTCTHPLVVEADPDLEALADAIVEASRRSPIVLVRDAAPDLERFEAITDRVGRMQMHRNTDLKLDNHGERRGLSDNGSTTVNLGHHEVPLHRERAYTPLSPEVLCFFCVSAPSSPAPTTMLDGCALYAQLPDDLREWAEHNSVLYEESFALDSRLRSLVCAAYGVETMAEVRERMPVIARQIMPEDTFELTEFTDDRISYTIVSPLVRRKTRQGRPAVVTTIRWARRRLSDGRPGAEVPQWRRLEALLVANEREHQWRSGDLVVMDNNGSMHGRRAHEAADRTIAIRMGCWKSRAPVA